MIATAAAAVTGCCEAGCDAAGHGFEDCGGVGEFFEFPEVFF